MVTLAELDAEIASRAPKKAPKPDLFQITAPISPFQAELQAGRTVTPSLAQGVLQAGQGVAQLATSPFPGLQRRITQASEAERQRFAATPAGRDPLSGFGVGLGEAGAQLAALPAGGEALGLGRLPATFLGRAARVAGEGGLLGASQFVQPGGVPRAVRTLGGAALGGGLGAGTEAVATVAPRAIELGRQALGRPAAVARRILSQIKPEDVAKTTAAARRLEVPLSPAEASADQITAAKEGALGRTEQGAATLLSSAKGKIEKQKTAIRLLLRNISPQDESAARNIRDAAKNVLSTKQKALNKIAEPLYARAHASNVPQQELDNLLEKVPGIKDEIALVRQDPFLDQSLKNADDTNIGILHEAKQNLDDRISSLDRKGEFKQSRRVKTARNSLDSLLKASSEDYAKANAIYSVEKAPIAALQNTAIGRIAKLNDNQLKSISRVIFDPAQTDIKELNQIRDAIRTVNPKAANQIARNEMERRLAAVRGAGDIEGAVAGEGLTGSAFHRNILASDRDFNMFRSWFKGQPKIQQKLLDMRLAFRNLSALPSVQRAATESARLQGRSVETAGLNAAANMLRSRYDNAAIRLITEGKWEKELARIRRTPNQGERAIKMARLLARISAQQATQERGR